MISIKSFIPAKKFKGAQFPSQRNATPRICLYETSIKKKSSVDNLISIDKSKFKLGKKVQLFTLKNLLRTDSAWRFASRQEFRHFVIKNQFLQLLFLLPSSMSTVFFISFINLGTATIREKNVKPCP